MRTEAVQELNYVTVKDVVSLRGGCSFLLAAQIDNVNAVRRITLLLLYDIIDDIFNSIWN